MFSKTRIRLTALNAIVFFVIIVFLSVIVYTQLHHQLYAKVDESLKMRAQQDSQFFYEKSQFFLSNDPKNLIEGTTKKTLIQFQGIDPRVFLVLWDVHGNSFPILAGADNKRSVEAFKPYRSVPTPQTIKVDGHSYRIYAIDYDQPKAMNVRILSDTSLLNELNQAPSQIVSVQAISIIDSEQNMLKQLLKLILFGIFGGGAVTVLAGLYLANQALQPIRRSWEKQQQFVADVSHELRMPLSIIQANAELVFRHPDRSILAMSEPLSMVLAETKQMGRLTEQLLTLARADSNQEEIILKPLSLAELIREVTQKFEPLAELKQQKLKIDLESMPEITGDHERLHQLLVILLDNSMKFTPEDGTILVSARKGHSIDIVVEDTGIGIAAEDLPHIFDRFYRGDKARSRSNGGTGLGLAIAKWIVNKHGGDITAASVLGQGTTMTIRLPVGQRK